MILFHIEDHGVGGVEHVKGTVKLARLYHDQIAASDTGSATDLRAVGTHNERGILAALDQDMAQQGGGGGFAVRAGNGNAPATDHQAAEKLGEDFDCALINPRFTKPIDQATTEYFAKTADMIVTIEDHVLAGGYGSIVAELLVEKGIHTPLTRVGWPDQFIEHASSVGELREKYGLTAEAVVAQIKSAPASEAAGNKASVVA